MSVTHDPINDLWNFTYASPEVPDTEYVEAMTYAGDFTLMAQMAILPSAGGLGLFFRKAGETQFYFTLRTTPLDPPEATQIEGAPQWLKIEYYEGAAHLAYGFDNNWHDLDPIEVERPDQVGMVMLVDQHSSIVRGLIAEYRLLPDRYTTSTTEVGVAPMQAVAAQFGAPVATAEALVHGIVGAQFGDLEFDVGKSVRWTEWFVDDTYITDINTGTQRYWVVNWTLTTPEAFHGVTDKNFFVDPIGFRKEQFLQASRSLIVDDTDWVLFVDAHEGMSVDSRSLPDDYLIEPFRSFIYREIARAEAASKDRVVIPFFVFLRHDHIQNVTWGSDPNTGPMEQALGVPYYLPQQGLTRLVRVSALRHPNFDWTTIDRPTAVVDPTVKIQLVSYGYAHWNMQDVVPPATTVAPLTAENDDGWRQRCMLSQVRPIGSLPTDPSYPYGSWSPPSTDPTGDVGPWAADFPGVPPADLYVEDPPPSPSAATAGVLVPLYDTVFRLNFRDGVWYDVEESGNIPLAWDGTTWVPTVDPKAWAS